MRLEKNGFLLNLEGTWMEISNKYGVLEYGDVAVDPEYIKKGFAERKLEKFIERHRVADVETPTCIKRVAYDPESKEYIQLQAVLQTGEECWIIQKFDNELVYMGEIWTGCKYQDEVKYWMHSDFDIESCLTAEVFRSGLGDCTNGGISAERRELYILGSDGPFEPSDIRECVTVEKKMVLGQEHLDAKPVYCQNKWYMMGGNFLYTSDSRFREFTGLSYPIPIHDRCEGR